MLLTIKILLFFGLFALFKFVEVCNLTEKLASKLLPGFMMCNRAISPTYDVKTTRLKESLSFCNWEWPSKKEFALGA